MIEWTIAKFDVTRDTRVFLPHLLTRLREWDDPRIVDQVGYKPVIDVRLVTE